MGSDEGRVTPMYGVWCGVGIVVVIPWIFCVVVLRRNEELCDRGCGSGVRLWCVCVLLFVWCRLCFHLCDLWFR